jgi:hypothetical protein
MQYSDYTPPPVPSVVIDGEVVSVSKEAVEALAMNAMLLTMPNPNPPPSEGGTPDDDPFMAELMEALMTPLPQTGDRLIANGRPGTFVGRKPEAVTCQVTYIIDHDDGERVEWVLNDWDRNKPEIVFDH